MSLLKKVKREKNGMWVSSVDVERVEWAQAVGGGAWGDYFSVHLGYRHKVLFLSKREEKKAVGEGSYIRPKLCR